MEIWQGWGWPGTGQTSGGTRDRSGVLERNSHSLECYQMEVLPPRLWSLWLISSGPTHQSAPITLFIVLQSTVSCLAPPHREKNGEFFVNIEIFYCHNEPNLILWSNYSGNFLHGTLTIGIYLHAETQAAPSQLWFIFARMIEIF